MTGTVAFSAKRSTHTVGYVLGTQYAVGMQYTVGMQYAVGKQYGVGTQYTVGVSEKRSTHCGVSKYGWWRPLPLVQKGQTHAVGYASSSRYAVRSRYAVGVIAKRSTHTVDLANMGGGDRYP